MPEPTRATRTSRIGVVALLILAGQALVSRIVSTYDQPPPYSPNLQSFPARIGSWVGSQDHVLEADVAELLRPDEYLLRDFESQDHTHAISLFFAYFKSVSSGYGPHSPNDCLPGAGWQITSRDTLSISVPGKKDGIRVNRYVVARDDQRILVLYWYQNDRRVWAEESVSRLYKLTDLIRYHRSDASLVRVITPLSNDTPADAQIEMASQFIRQIFPVVQDHLARVRQTPATSPSL